MSWPTRDGWHRGIVLAREPEDVPVQDGIGRPHMAQSLRLTLRDDATGRTIRRNIRDCCADIPGPCIERTADAALCSA